ncbi:MAG: hypothetical protein KGL39_26365, partial [Patescibacteria group bacterium]|nr:hypothetical protein [Patescibacteria group bacterium]
TSLPPEEAHRLVADALGAKGHQVWVNMLEKQQKERQAMAVPLPGEAGDAFLKGAIKVGDFVVNEVFPVHPKALQSVDSPLLSIMAPRQQTDDGKVSVEIEPKQEREICFIFTCDPESLEDTPKERLADFIRAGAKEKFGRANSATIAAIVNSVFIQWLRHRQTQVELHSAIETQVEKKTFQALMQALSQPD